MTRYTIEIPDNSPFFTTTDEDGNPAPVTIVAFTRGVHGSDLIHDLQRASDDGWIVGDFQLAEVVQDAD